MKKANCRCVQPLPDDDDNDTVSSPLATQQRWLATLLCWDNAILVTNMNYTPTPSTFA
jgi:hypothetical protein